MTTAERRVKAPSPRPTPRCFSTAGEEARVERQPTGGGGGGGGGGGDAEVRSTLVSSGVVLQNSDGVDALLPHAGLSIALFNYAL